MPRAEKRATQCFVSTTDVQILQNILDLVHTAGITNYVQCMCTLLDSCTEQFYSGHFPHLQMLYTRPSPVFWEGPGYEATL